MNFRILFIAMLCIWPIFPMEKPRQMSSEALVSEAFILTIAGQIRTFMNDLAMNHILAGLLLQKAFAATLAPHPDLALIITHLQKAKQSVQKTSPIITEKIQKIIDLLRIASQEEKELEGAIQMSKEQVESPKASTHARRAAPKLSPLSPASKGKMPPQEASPLLGFPNPDQRCFMSAGFQSIFSLDTIIDAVLAQAHLDPNFYTSKPMADTFVKLARSFREHMAQFENKEKEDEQQELRSQTEFCNAARKRMELRPAEQADSGEFLQYLIDDLLHPALGKTNGQLKRLLSFTITNNEEGVPHQEEVFRLQVAPPEVMQKKLPPITLKECIDNFFLPEYLPNEKIRTPVLSSLSPYFIVELTRRKQNEKIMTSVSFPLEDFKITAHLFGIPSERVYRLKAFIIHSGSAKGGHYYAYVRYADQWYRTDDNAIRKAPVSEIEQIASLGYDKEQNETPTIFFYETNF